MVEVIIRYYYDAMWLILNLSTIINVHLSSALVELLHYERYLTWFQGRLFLTRYWMMGLVGIRESFSR